MLMTRELLRMSTFLLKLLLSMRTQDLSVDSSAPILDEVHTSSEGTSDVIGVVVESNTLIPDDMCVHVDDTRMHCICLLHIMKSLNR